MVSSLDRSAPTTMRMPPLWSPRYLVVALALLLASASCEAEHPTRNTFRRAQLGTVTTLIYYTPEGTDAAPLARQCFAIVDALERTLSDYLPDSELNTLCQRPLRQPHPISEHLYTVLHAAQEISRQSDGTLDVTLGRWTQAWRARKQGQPAPPLAPPPPHHYRSLLLSDAPRTAQLQVPLQLDLGAIAKGYLADLLMDHLHSHGITQAAVAVGSETVLSAAPPGKPGWMIAVEDPQQERVGHLMLHDVALSTSGESYQLITDTQQSHLIRARTGLGATDQLNVTVLAPTAMQADAWATTLRLLGPPPHARVTLPPDIHALFLTTDSPPITLNSHAAFPPLITQSVHDKHD